MADLHAPLRPAAGGSSLSTFTANLILYLTLLSLSLAFFAFLLQWHGGGAIHDPFFPSFPGLDSSYTVTVKSSSDCSPFLGGSDAAAFPHFRNWTFAFDDGGRPKICITTTTSAGLEVILPWIFYHKVIGVSSFFLFVEGNAASFAVSKVLESIPGVKLIPRTKELEEQQAKSRAWNETWLSEMFYKPCNHELFVKQSLNMEMGIAMARDAGMEWILHLDTDELIHPSGSQEYSLRQLLHDVPQEVDAVVFTNYESIVERDDIKDPFTEVSVFKKNYDHLPGDTYNKMYKLAIRQNPNYFLTYGNGKSAARIHDHLRSNGAHRWENYVKEPKEMMMDEAAVLHYSYAKFSDLTSRSRRCRCKPTKEGVKRCFFMEFDRNAFIIASTATEEAMLKWYNEHVVWNNKTINKILLKSGIFERIYTPMTIIQGLKESGTFASIKNPLAL